VGDTRQEPGDLVPSVDRSTRSLTLSAGIADDDHVGSIRAFDPGPGGWVSCTATCRSSTTTFAEDGQITWLDFDLCGYGWRAYDIAYYYTRIPEPVSLTWLGTSARPALGRGDHRAAHHRPHPAATQMAVLPTDPASGRRSCQSPRSGSRALG
jgi:hypothetical protein